MMDLCGYCFRSPCACLATVKPSPSDGATGEALDRIAREVGLRRVNLGSFVETDDTLRARVQITVVLGVPYTSGVECGDRLDKVGSRRGIFRGAGESDSRYRARQILSGAGYAKKHPERKQDRVAGVSNLS